MAMNASAPWHKESYDRFLHERLPALLAERIPLADYAVDPAGDAACRIRVSIGATGKEVAAEFADIPVPADDGVFRVGGRNLVVIPTADREELDRARIRCVGKQLCEFIAERLGEVPADLPWDEELLRSVVPLDRWVAEFMQPGPWGAPPKSVQVLDEQNWLARHEHTRRLLIPDRQKIVAEGQFGRICPIQTPEGANIGRVLSISVGAEIRDGSLVIVDDSPAAALSLTASMIPLLEHSDPNRLLMGANMMRQMLVPPDPEPALVQTGNEPDAPGFWCGRNLLTAFVSWGPETFEDGIAISESCAERLSYPDPVQPGDKLANRHGTKGTVARILPDDEMPHLADGTAVEIVYSFIGLHTRLNFGQVREAILGRIARAEGRTVVVPPFAAPDDVELRRRLRDCRLPESGMETLTLGRGGKKLRRPSTVGWVYWGRLHHIALEKLCASTDPAGPCNRQGRLEYYTFRDAGAIENLLETFNTRSVDRPDAAALAERVAAGEVSQAGPPTPAFTELQRRLGIAGIRAEFDGTKVTFAFASPAGDAVKLAEPVPHPWITGPQLTEIGRCEELPAWAELVEANTRLERMDRGRTPRSLRDKAAAVLAGTVARLLDELVRPEHVEHGGRVTFSGRAVISPGLGLRIDQLGVPEEIAWTLFAPLAVRRVGSDEVRRRTDKAAAALDEIMAESWVLLNRAPSVLPTSILAFRPVRIGDGVNRLHPLACRMLNADFDGDQAAVFLPVTAAAQREAGERLTVAAHIRRDPGLLAWVIPTHDILWGLAELSLTSRGRGEIDELATVEVSAPDGFVTRESLGEAMKSLMERDGVEEAMQALDRLLKRGFQAAKESGASMSPFIGESVERPAAPEGEDARAWHRYFEQLAERLASRRDFDSPDLGPQLLSVLCGARGRMEHLMVQVSEARFQPDCLPVPARRGLRDGLEPAEMFARAASAREALGQVAVDCVRRAYGIAEAARSGAFTVLARAMRAPHPGIVFAHAAAIGETDPLTDLDARLFLGLPAK